MTYLLSIDPGVNTGIALGYYDAITPYRLVERWQVHNGLDGFIRWWETAVWAGGPLDLSFDEIVCEKFLLADNDFKADVTPLLIEGALIVLNRQSYNVPIVWQPNTDKAGLVGYPSEAKTKAQRQRVRFDFLERFGLFKAGTENDDTNDAIVHALVSLKKRLHSPTLLAMWPPRPVR